MTCTNNMKQLSIACHNFASANDDTMPAYYFKVGTVDNAAETQIFVSLLSHLEQAPLYATFGTPVNLQRSGTNSGHRGTFKGFFCPSDPTIANGLGQGDWASGNYVANFQVFGRPSAGNNAPGNANGRPDLKNAFPDGTSSTILFAEKIALTPGHWVLWAHGGWNNSWSPLFAYGSADGSTPFTNGMDGGTTGYVGANSKFLNPRGPYDTTNTIGLASSPHTSGMVTGFADGSVKFISSGIDSTTVTSPWWSLCTPARGEVIGDF